MSKLTLGEKIAKIEDRVAVLEKKISEAPAAGLPKRMLTTEEAATFLGMTLDGLRGLTYKKLIPYYKPNGKNMYFEVDELVAWQKKNHFEPIRNVAADGES